MKMSKRVLEWLLCFASASLLLCRFPFVILHVEVEEEHKERKSSDICNEPCFKSSSARNAHKIEVREEDGRDNVDDELDDLKCREVSAPPNISSVHALKGIIIIH